MLVKELQSLALDVELVTKDGKKASWAHVDKGDD